MKTHRWPESIIKVIHKKENNRSTGKRNHFIANANANAGDQKTCYMSQFGLNDTPDSKMSFVEKKKILDQDWTDTEHECPFCTNYRAAGKETLCLRFEPDGNGTVVKVRRTIFMFGVTKV